jgi:hypothetical protein
MPDLPASKIAVAATHRSFSAATRDPPSTFAPRPEGAALVGPDRQHSRGGQYNGAQDAGAVSGRMHITPPTVLSACLRDMSDAGHGLRSTDPHDGVVSAVDGGERPNASGSTAAGPTAHSLAELHRAN